MPPIDPLNSNDSPGWFAQKWNTAWSVAKDKGLRGVALAGLDMLARGALPIRRFQHWLFWQDHWILGKWVEWRGNRVTLEGMSFSVDHPSISTRLKSRFYMGRYEEPERRAINHIDPDIPLVELGGGVGVVSCLANHRLSRPQEHVVIEANPEMIPLLEHNRDMNKCQFQIINCAIGYGKPEVLLQLHDSMLDTTLRRTGIREKKIQSINLAAILERFGFKVCSLICDIEGMELDLIDNEIDVLKEHVTQLAVEIHPGITGHDFTESKLKMLESAGFRRSHVLGPKNFIYQNLGVKII